MIIKCPNCNEEISSKAFKCVHCGAEFTHHCEECNAPLKESDTICSNCGCPVYDRRASRKKEKSSIAGLIIGLIIIICLGVLGYFAYNSYSKYNAKRNFLMSFYEVVPVIATSTVEVEEVGILINKVWNNSIWKKNDAETNMYTKANSGTGAFYDDFNEALARLYDDPDYSKKVEKINEDQTKIMKIMRDLKKPDEEEMDMYNDLKKYYDDYLNFSNTVLYTKGKSLSSYTDEFKENQKNIMNSTLKLKQYIAN